MRTVESIPAAAACEANDGQGVLPRRLAPLEASMRLAGPALPVSIPPGDNLWLHRALGRAERGSVLVVAMATSGRRREYGYWGELMTAAARRRGLAGLVIDGSVRDRRAIVESGLPVFCAGLSPLGTTKDPGAAGSLGEVVEIGGVRVAAGDLVVGDADGVVVVAAAREAVVRQRVARRLADERRMLERLEAGLSTLEVLGLPE